MKNISFVFACMLLLSCGSNRKSPTEVDSMNAIDNRRQTQDTDVTPFPDGYAPPNADVDSSQHTKDSVDSVRH